ncbi:GNAT family N-acetyltransferase [Halomonas sp. M4R1S46]|uniref:GNAT family N-acetyltransferase n=1 Tax=Halomonas sp. M4R1S46 TaxID=2982692 RepID=UPI0021E36294|nr:GNAT family N-acetyltransferase [Halomonas sp. M4R1S46]UYG08427.1 GNAT family N-acetyltransferase [Halomonas sp. M4R1S46]
MRHADPVSTAPPDGPAAGTKAPRILYRQARVQDGTDQAEVFHHAVMQGAMAHYALAAREAWAAVLPREGCAWAARQVLYTTLVATCDGRCVGFIEIDPRRHYVESLYVWPSLARRGIGSTLLEHAERLLREQGATRLGIDASLVMADGLERRGWRRVREEWVERGGQRLCRRHLEKSLTAC